MKELRFFWVTSAQDPEGYAPERPLIEMLRQRGHEVLPWVWDLRPLPILDGRDRVIVRTPDYFGKTAAFRSWLGTLPAAQIYNSRKVIAWNSEKTYLQDLEREGVRIIPTHWVERGNEKTLSLQIEKSFSEFRERYGSEEVIIKPVFSAASFHTYRLAKGALPPPEAFEGRAAMIQPFRREILSEGESSFVYFQGRFSHAIRKRPRSGDFRIQESFGGRFETLTPNSAELEFGDFVMRKISARFPEEGGPLYGRVDFLNLDGVPHVMEVELFEPDLYLHHSPGAAERFLTALEGL